MFKEVLQIIPQLSSGDLANMEKALGSRFTKIAKSFGKGLLATLTGGGVAGLALGLVDKLLNPLKEVQEAIDKTLNRGSDLAVQAKQFNTTAGELAKLQAFGQAKGLEPEAVNHLIEKFQSAVSEAIADPTKQTSVRQFTGQKDTAQAFFDFIQGLQKLDKNKQIQVQQEVFGEKQILRMSEFLNADFEKLNSKFKGISTEAITQKVEKVDNLDELNKTLGAVRGLKDFNDKADAMNKQMIVLRNEQEKRQLEIQNKQLSSYQNLQNIEAASTEILNTVKEGILKLTDIVLKLTHFTENFKKLMNSSWLRRLGLGSKED
jgi:hypothetical protein